MTTTVTLPLQVLHDLLILAGDAIDMPEPRPQHLIKSFNAASDAFLKAAGQKPEPKP
jgi:hypothetical protein